MAGGGGASTVMTEDGAFTSGSTGLQTKQVAVVKCKDCGEILNEERNYHYTAEELARMKAELQASGDSGDSGSMIIFLPTTAFALICLIAAINGLKNGGGNMMIFVGFWSLPFGYIAWKFRPTFRWK